MGKNYIVVDFEDLDPKLFTLLPKRENGFGGYSHEILYDGKKLYVRYGKRKCRGGVVRWTNGGFSVGISLSDGDLYHWKAYDIDWHFMMEFGFGSKWNYTVTGDVFRSFYFKVTADGGVNETKFFGKSVGSYLGEAVPRKSNICILALWDRVSVGHYGVTIRPKAIQVNVVSLDETVYDEEGPCMFYSEEVRRFYTPILQAPLG